MRCRTVICAACCTRVQGINHCHACLERLARPRPRAGSGAGSVLGGLVLLGLAWAALFGLLLLVQGSLAP
jgi:hypothetical protein